MSRRPNKIDLELAKLEVSSRNSGMIIRGATIVAGILATTLPVWVFGRTTVEPLAGKATTVNVNVALAVSVAVSVVLNGLQYVKGLTRKSELKRIRERLRQLERDAGLTP